jgi:hypothetical protein
MLIESTEPISELLSQVKDDSSSSSSSKGIGSDFSEDPNDPLRELENDPDWESDCLLEEVPEDVFESSLKLLIGVKPKKSNFNS